MGNAVEFGKSCRNDCLKMFMENLPPGVKFLPSDAEMFELLNKKNGDYEDSSVQFIKEIDLLKHEPWELPRLSSHQHFFYAPEPYGKGKCRKRKRNGESCKQECFKRSTKSGSGYWEQAGPAKPIDGFGVRRTLRFYLNNPGSKKKKGDWTDYKIYQYEPTDFGFSKAKPIVVLRLGRNPADKCTSKCEAGLSELLDSNFVNSVTEITLPELPNEGELLNGMLTDPSNADEGVLSQDIMHSCSLVEGQADLHRSASDFGSRDGLKEMVLHHHPELQESSEVNHTLLFDQVHPRQQSTSGFGTEVADAFGLQMDPQPLVESETQAGGGALPSPIDQEFGLSTFEGFEIDNLSNSQFDIDQEDWFTNLEHTTTLSDINLRNSIGGVDVRYTGDTNTNAAYQRVTEYSQINFGEY